MSDYKFKRIVTKKDRISTIVEAVYVPDEVVKQIRADAIDDFVNKVKERQYVLHILSDFMNCEDYGMFTVGIEEIAEELKAGGKNE